tara:strand:- start:67036 stop:67152 length:117 start_codon:yes stop_codon:yes gene_type:complete
MPKLNILYIHGFGSHRFSHMDEALPLIEFLWAETAINR